MTDLATKPGADPAPGDDASTGADAAATEVIAGDASQTYEWAPTEPARRKRRLWLWIGIPVAAVAIGAGAASAVLIAPGTTVAGVPVGGMTQGAAAELIAQRLADTTVVLTGSGDGTQVTAADLGASVDAQALAQQAFAQHPAWNVTAWFAPAMPVAVTIDQATAADVLRDKVPSLYTAPTDAQIAFDAASASYITVPAVQGEGIDSAAVVAALDGAFATGDESVDLAATTVAIDADTPTYVADATVKTLNSMLDNAGFYVGSERTVPIDRATLASWMTVSASDRGTFTIKADAAAIQPVVDGLPAAVDRAAVDSTVIVNSSGTVLATPTAGVTGRALDSTAGIANSFADQLASGSAVYELPVTEVAFTTTTLDRMLEVDLSEQRLYLKENGVVVDSWLISSGLSFPTEQGHYRINSHYTVQTMNGYNADGTKYSTPNVKWIMYFNGGQAFHGVYWHNNFGHPMSHGCVGMPEWRAQQLYNWTSNGADVWIHA